MSILDRLNLLIRSNLNDTSARSGNPWRDKMRDMESSLRDARRQLAELRTSERHFADQIRQERDRAEQWEDRAMLALREGDEDLAREAIVVKNKAMREAQRLREQLDDHRAYMRDIESSLQALEVKLDGTRGKMRHAGRTHTGGPNRSSAARGERDWDAEMRRRMRERDGGAQARDERRSRRDEGSRRPSTSGGAETFDTDGTFREFDRMSNRISTMEAEIDAIRELSDDDLFDPRRRELESIFDRMEQNKRTDADLSDLKRRFKDD